MVKSGARSLEPELFPSPKTDELPLVLLPQAMAATVNIIANGIRNRSLIFFPSAGLLSIDLPLKLSSVVNRW
jgi:hypothetical protein